jgi:hypothetical protein
LTVTAIGEIAIGDAVPGVQGALAEATADIQGKVAALATFAPVPPELNASLELVAEMSENLGLAVSLGITPPSLDVQLAIVTALVLELKAKLQIILDLSNLLGASVHLYRYDGATGSFGTEMQTELSGGLPGGSGSDTAFALTFIATESAAIVALQSIFKISP